MQHTALLYLLRPPGERGGAQLADIPDGDASDEGVPGGGHGQGDSHVPDPRHGRSLHGDIPTFEKTNADTRKEDDILLNWVNTLPEDAREEWAALLTEMNAMETQEAKIYKALDKMEAVIQHNESDISTWLPLEYDLQMTYGEENVQFSPYMQQLKAEVNDWTREKIAREKPE